MTIIVQYVFVAILVVGIVYFIYLVQEKNIRLNEDYYGITYSILNSLGSESQTQESVKEILRVVSKAVHYVEDNHKNECNELKEDRALQLAKEGLIELNLRRIIDDDSIRYIIRLSTAVLPPTNKDVRI